MRVLSRSAESFPQELIHLYGIAPRLVHDGRSDLSGALSLTAVVTTIAWECVGEGVKRGDVVYGVHVPGLIRLSRSRPWARLAQSFAIYTGYARGQGKMGRTTRFLK